MSPMGWPAPRSISSLQAVDLIAREQLKPQRDVREQAILRVHCPKVYGNDHRQRASRAMHLASIRVIVWAALRHDRGRVGRPNATLARMAHNPMGTDGFEFVEYTAPDPRALRALFESLGFEQVARHRSKDVVLYRQGEINFIVNAEPDSFSQEFARAHGPSICAIALRVKDAAAAYKRALELGARPHVGQIGPMELAIPAIKGIGESAIYLVDRYGDRTIYDVDFVPSRRRAHRDRRRPARCSRSPKASGCSTSITSPTTSSAATWSVWADFYERLFGFREIRYFDIHGKLTGLRSRALASPCGKIRIPDQRVGRREVADRRVPARLPRRGHPAPRAGLPRHLRGGRGAARARRAAARHARQLLRAARRAPARPRRGPRAPAARTRSSSTAPRAASGGCCSRSSPRP